MKGKVDILTTVAVAAFSVALTTDAADFRVAVPETWRPVKIGEKDFFAVMRGKWIDDPSLQPTNAAAFRSLFLRMGGWCEPLGYNDYLPFNEKMPDAKRCRKYPYTVLDMMGPYLPWVKNREVVDWYQKNRPDVPYNLVSREAHYPWLMRETYDCDTEHFKTWRTAHPNFQGFEVMNENNFGSPTDTDQNAGDYGRTTNAEIRAHIEKGFPPQKTYAGRIRNWLPTAVDRWNAMHFGSNAYSLNAIWDAKYAHHCGRMGFKNAFCELNAWTCSAPWSMAMWHYRGASRQFRMPFFFYMATSLNGYGTDGKPRLGHWRCETTIPEEYDSHCGITRSLGRRFYFYDYFAGANGIEVKQCDHCFYDDRTPGQLKPSVFFEDYNAIFELAERQPRGVAWTPVAALTSSYEGFQIHGYNKFVCRDGFAPNAFFYTLLTPGGTHPYRGLCDRRKGEDGCLYNSEFGEICDVICPDAGQTSDVFARVLAPYRAAFLIGGFPYPKDYDLAAVRAWTEAGGTLVCSEDALADGLVTAEMSGVSFGDDRKPSGRTLCRADGTTVDALADAYTFFVGKPMTAKPYLKDENGTVVAWENVFGKGRVITVAAYQSLPDRFVNVKDLPEEEWYDKLQGEVASGKATFPIQRHLLRRFQKDFMPVSVSGDVQWGVNRLDDGMWLVWLNNNKGVTHFQGDWSERQSDAATAFVTLVEKATGRVPKLTVSSGESRFVRLVDMPTFPEGFAETNRYAAVDLIEPFDLAITANRPSQRKRSNRDRPEFSCSVVPCEMFTRAYVLCSVSDDPARERAFNVRLTR